MKQVKSMTGFYPGAMLLLSTVFILTFTACMKRGWTDEVAERRVIVNAITINEGDSLPLLLGRDTALTAVYKPDSVTNNGLTWSSENESIAKVDQNGKVTTVGLGTANIYVASVDGGMRKAAIKIMVIDRITYAAEVKISPAALTTYPKIKTQLTATVLPANVTYKRLTWSSSNTAVATVDQTGLLTAVSDGTVTITAKAADGSNTQGTLIVEVVKVTPIESIKINTVLTDGIAPDERLALDYIVLPATASKQLISWTSDNTAVATVADGGIVTGVAPGQAVITGTSIDGNSIVVKYTVDVMEGKINDTFTDGVTPRWITPTSGASVAVQNNILWVTMNTGTNRRGDFRRTNTTLHIGKYPIIAFKFTRPLATAGNIFFDTNQGRWKQTTGNGNNQMTILLDKNNEQVFYANMGEFNTFGTAGFTLPTTTSYTFSQIAIGVADFPTAQNPLSPFPVYWIKTFKTVAELQSYISK